MKKKIIFIVIAIIILPIAWYLLSPLLRVVEVDEVSPLATPREAVVKDAMDTMDAATKIEFEQQVMEASKNLKEMKEAMPDTARLVARGDFRPRAHDVAGRALLIEKDGKLILRFEDFETINGPDLRIFLSSELGTDDAISLGSIRATKGNVNYELPEGVDVKKYNKVLVWCYAFSILFSYAELNSS